MNLNKMFVFIFVFFIMFAILLAIMPSEFQVLGIDAAVQDKEAADFFNAHNVTMYNYTLTVNLTKGAAQSFPFGFPEGQKLEFWWDYEYYYYIGNVLMLELRHLSWTFWWWAYHELHVSPPYANLVFDPDVGLTKDDVLTLWDEDKNASYCELDCDHLNVKLFILTANQTWTLEESWDNGEVKLYTSYDIDWARTGTSMWLVMGQLLSFQNPDLGIGGTFGQVLSAGIGGTLWACIAVLFFAIITSVIPFISGWVGGD